MYNAISPSLPWSFPPTCHGSRIALGTLLWASLLLACPVPARPGTLELERDLMGTRVELVLCGGEEPVLHRAGRAAFAEIERIEGLFSLKTPDSRVSEINRMAGIQAVVVPSELYSVTEAAMRISLLSGGAFDITVQALIPLWNLASPTFRPPNRDLVMDALQKVDFTRVRLEPQASSVFLPQKGMQISYGGIAKGYAVDQAVKVLGGFALSGGVVSAGGDLRAFGRKESGELWRVGIVNPRKENQSVCVVPLTNTAVATSGDYERFRFFEGTRYHHILDPKTGYPARGCMSATVIARHAMDADALATAVFVLGPEKGLKLLEEHPDAEGAVITSEGDLLTSPGLDIQYP